MLKYYLGGIAVLFFLVSCETKFPDYLKVEEDIYLKLISFDESDESLESEGYSSVCITVKDNEKLIYRKYKEDVVLNASNQFLFLMKNLNEGDSAIFKVSTKRISSILSPYLIEETMSEFVEVIVKIHNYYTAKEYLGLKKKIDQEMLEQVLLNNYLEEINAEKKEGIYKEVLIEGEGDLVTKGDEITIGYKGYFINRLQFDEIAGNTSFRFVYGNQGQVIDGLNFAIKSMRVREKSKIIIPSQLAFGDEGSTSLIVPPFTTVIYELEILKIN
jgi:FKBP-type peptidyl-prolyl cis-trans isomerase